ncbi:MAG: glycosyltransferase [Azospirillum sp.]|nr:glycosyltransferase [Azospirillum sp.]
MLTFDIAELLGLGLMAVSLAGAGYLILAGWAVRRFARLPNPAPRLRPAVTILKPVCGDDPGLYDNLRSFCLQAYPNVQVVFGAHGPDDPAVPVVRRLIAERSAADPAGADLTLVIEPRLHGSNYKISNLINMMPAARHGLIVLADSDMRVGTGYLDAVVAPLGDPAVGLVTCLYRGRPAAGVWSKLAAMFVNHGFLPSVLVGRIVGAREGCFGATIALRRETLERIGGFESLRDQLADDYALGAAVRRLGLAAVMSTEVVDNVMREPGLRSLIDHELRWARTLRSIEPAGFAASIVTFPLLPALLGVVLTGAGLSSMITLAFVLACRYGFMATVDQALELESVPLWLPPVRDLLSVGVLIASFWISNVTWRHQRFRVEADGRLTTDGVVRP